MKPSEMVAKLEELESIISELKSGCESMAEEKAGKPAMEEEADLSSFDEYEE